MTFHASGVKDVYSAVHSYSGLVCFTVARYFVKGEARAHMVSLLIEYFIGSDKIILFLYNVLNCTLVCVRMYVCMYVCTGMYVCMYICVCVLYSLPYLHNINNEVILLG